MTAAPYDEAPTGDAGMEDEGLSDMGSLLEAESMEPRSVRRGEIVPGTVVSVSRDGVVVDIGSKSEAIVPTSEMHSLGAEPLSKLHTGEEVLVYVMQGDSGDGHMLVSLDKARGEQGWRVLQERFQSGELFDAEVTGHNKGGLLVNVEGVNAFLPLSQITSPREGEAGLSSMVGQQVKLKVIELNRRRNRAILSQRAAMHEWRASQKDKLLDELEEGEVREGHVSSVRDFGVFVDLGGADGLVHLSELSWDRQKSPQDAFKPGQAVQVFVLKVDRENKKIALSMRRAQPQQWEHLAENYQVGEMVYGRVTKVVDFGAFVRLEGSIEGLIHVSELADRRINHPRDVVREGDIVPVKVVRIEKERHRLGLSLRGARDEAERVGFVFNDQGGILRVPDYVLEQFGEQPRREAAQDVTPAERAAPMTAFAEAFSRAAEAAEANAAEAKSQDYVGAEDEEPRTAFAEAFSRAEAQAAESARQNESLEAAEATTSEAETLETQAPVAEMSEAEPPEAETPEAEAPVAEMSEAEPPNAEAPDAEMSEAETPPEAEDKAEPAVQEDEPASEPEEKPDES